MTPINPLQAPINYAVDVSSPFEAALGGFKAGLAGAESQARTKESLAREAEYLSKIQDARDKERQQQTAVAVATDPMSTRSQVLTATVGLDPAQAKMITDGFNSLSEEKKQPQLNFLAGVYSAFASGAPEIGKGQLQAQEVAYNNAGMKREAQAITDALKLIDINPVKAMEITGQIISAIPGGKDLLANIQTNQETIRSRNTLSPAIQETLDYANLTPEERALFDTLNKKFPPVTNILVDTAAKATGVELGKLVPELYDRINAAATLFNNIPGYRKALGNAITGPFANKILEAERLANLFGFRGDKEQKIDATRALIQGLSEMALNSRSMLTGQGSVSNYEGQLLQEARGGKINFTAGEIGVILDVASRASKQQHAQNYKLLREAAKGNDPATIFLKTITPLNLGKPNPTEKSTTPTPGSTKTTVNKGNTGSKITVTY